MCTDLDLAERPWPASVESVGPRRELDPVAAHDAPVDHEAQREEDVALVRVRRKVDSVGHQSTLDQACIQSGNLVIEHGNRWSISLPT